MWSVDQQRVHRLTTGYIIGHSMPLRPSQRKCVGALRKLLTGQRPLADSQWPTRAISNVLLPSSATLATVFLTLVEPYERTECRSDSHVGTLVPSKPVGIAMFIPTIRPHLTGCRKTFRSTVRLRAVQDCTLR